MTKRDLIVLAIDQARVAEAWIDTLPVDIRDAYFDNTFTNAYGKVMDAALKLALGVDLYEDVMWWIYDAKSQVEKDGQTVIEIERGVASVRYCLRCNQDYMEYLEAEYKDLG